jgi:hypothetical protein
MRRRKQPSVERKRVINLKQEKVIKIIQQKEAIKIFTKGAEMLRKVEDLIN